MRNERPFRTAYSCNNRRGGQLEWNTCKFICLPAIISWKDIARIIKHWIASIFGVTAYYLNVARLLYWPPSMQPMNFGPIWVFFKLGQSVNVNSWHLCARAKVN